MLEFEIRGYRTVQFTPSFFFAVAACYQTLHRLKYNTMLCFAFCENSKVLLCQTPYPFLILLAPPPPTITLCPFSPLCELAVFLHLGILHKNTQTHVCKINARLPATTFCNGITVTHNTFPEHFVLRILVNAMSEAYIISWNLALLFTRWCMCVCASVTNMCLWSFMKKNSCKMCMQHTTTIPKKMRECLFESFFSTSSAWRCFIHYYFLYIHISSVICVSRQNCIIVENVAIFHPCLACMQMWLEPWNPFVLFAS